MRGSWRLCPVVAIGFVAALFALLCLIALLVEPPGRAPRSEPQRLELER